jgi:anti-sigma factor RsiW
MTDPCERLHAYVDGELDEATSTEFEAHLASCEACVAELPRLLALLDSLDGAGELARVKPPLLTVVDGGAATPTIAAAAPAAAGTTSAANAAAAPASDDLAVRRTRSASRRRIWTTAIGAAAAAAAMIVIIPRITRPPSTEVASLDGALGATRPFAGRLAYPGAGAYRPQNAERSASGPAVASDRLLQLQLQLEAAKNWHGLAVAALLAGDRERARQAFARAPATPEIDADRAALELLDGKPAALERGLDDVDRALAAAPSNAAAHWNRALVLAAMNLPLAAAKEFDDIAASHESGWADEAKTRAEALRTQVKQRNRHWKQAYEAGRRLIDDGTPVTPELFDVTGVMTIMLYDSVRAAPSRDRVLALLPLAKALDQAYRATRLADYVQRIAASDFAIRAPLAERYREVALGKATRDAKQALADQLANGAADDIRLGALVFAGKVAAQLDDYRRLAAASGDPWLILNAEQETAAAEVARHDTVAAERRLRNAIEHAHRERLTYRAIRLETDLVKLYKSTLRLSEAAAEAVAAFHEAIAAGEWLPEISALSDLASIHHNRSAYGLARAYLTEIAERANAGLASGRDASIDCQDRLYAYESLANISLLQLDPDRARGELANARQCDAQSISKNQAILTLRDALVRAELYRVGHRDDDARLARERLAAARELPASVAPGKDALLAFIEGDLKMRDDPVAGGVLLRDAIAKAGTETDEFSIKARAYSFALLTLEAGRASAFDQVLSITAETLGVHEPKRCVVAIAADAERSVVAFRDAAGVTDGQYVGERKRGTVEVATLIPARAVAQLRSCDRVAVLARAPVLGAGRLLPADMAWSYRLRDPAPAGNAAGAKRLVVANPDSPPDLGLPALAPYPDESLSGTMILRGADATPSRALAAMRNASVVEFHTHGIIADDLFETSQLVLSPEPDRQYALTPGDVAQVRLEASPLVILGACRAATSSRAPEGGMGLAEAFLRSGARAVIASPDAVQDRSALPFFTAIRNRVLAGADPAVALRDERVRQLEASHDETWVTGVVVFE